MYIFLDEGGDLGFDFTKKGTSNFFVVTLLMSKTQPTIKTINLAISKTLNRINNKKRKNLINELKGAHTPVRAKKGFLNKIIGGEWFLYTIIVDKKRFHKPTYIQHSSHLYNYIVGRLFNKVIAVNQQSFIVLTVDKCKTREQIRDFNRHIESIAYSNLSSYKLTIKHQESYKDKLLQAVDLFCNGIFSKYEHEDLSWYSCFQDKINIEDVL